MANEEHLALLRRGVRAWNAWRRKNPRVIPDLRGADLYYINLSKANLSSTLFTETLLDGADLSGANLNRAHMGWSSCDSAVLTGANLSEAVLQSANFTGAELEEAQMSKADLLLASFYNANLHKAILDQANLMEANFTGADFTSADLRDADLTKACVLGAEFTNARLTGACIENWNINGETILNNIDCDYVYLKQELDFSSAKSLSDIKFIRSERRPSSGKFAPGDFSRIFQIALNTIDLIFREPDWKAFAYSFREIQVENEGEELEIQSIENKGDGVIVVKVSVSPKADKDKIYDTFMQKYGSMHNLLMAQYEARIQDKDKEINRLVCLFNQANEKLGEVPKLVAENSKVHQIFNISGPITGFAGNVEGDQHNYAPEQRQNLAEAAAAIQQLLYQLAQTNPTSTEVVAEAIHQEIKRNPTLKARLVSALKAGGLEALKAIFNHPLFSIPAETVKGWLEAE